MNNELRNRALYLIAAHMNTNHEGTTSYNYTPERVSEFINNNTLNHSIRTAVNNALVSVIFTKGENIERGQPIIDLDNLKSELETILSEIDTKSKEKEAEEKAAWLAEYESTRPEVCPHQPE